FLFADTAPPEIYSLSLHDALPILPLAAAERFSRPGHIARRRGRCILGSQALRDRRRVPWLSDVPGPAAADQVVYLDFRPGIQRDGAICQFWRRGNPRCRCPLVAAFSQRAAVCGRRISFPGYTHRKPDPSGGTVGAAE